MVANEHERWMKYKLKYIHLPRCKSARARGFVIFGGRMAKEKCVTKHCTCYWYLMPRQRNVWIAATILIFIGLYAYVYRDSFRPKEIEIYHRIAVGPPMRGATRTNQAINVVQVAFGFDRKCKLTEIKVIPVAALETNKNPPPLWHLISHSNSIPIKAFAYGDNIRGLRPLVKHSRPLPLESNVTYRLIVVAGWQRGQHDFTLGETLPGSR